MNNKPKVSSVFRKKSLILTQKIARICKAKLDDPNVYFQYSYVAGFHKLYHVAQKKRKILSIQSSQNLTFLCCPRLLPMNQVLISVIESLPSLYNRNFKSQCFPMHQVLALLPHRVIVLDRETFSESVWRLAVWWLFLFFLERQNGGASLTQLTQRAFNKLSQRKKNWSKNFENLKNFKLFFSRAEISREIHPKKDS